MSKMITNSSRSTFQQCNRKYHISYNLGIRTGNVSVPLRKGDAVHGAMEVLAKGGSELEAIAELDKRYTSEELIWERAESIGLAIGWGRRYADDHILSYVSVEAEFEMPITNPRTGRAARNATAGGKIDGIATLPDGTTAVVEHKTTNESIEDLSGDYFGKLMMDSQVSMVILGARQLGYTTNTCIYDVVKKPGIKPKKVEKADAKIILETGLYYGLEVGTIPPERETPDMYTARLLADMAERPDFYFRRLEVVRSEDDLRQFQAELWVQKDQIRACELSEEEGAGIAAWPKNTGACTTMGTCQYFDMCRGLKPIENENGTVPLGFRRAERMHEELKEVGNG